MSSSVILFNKPYGVLSQFTREGNWESLADFGPFPAHVYCAGRLDADSEGLLLLTDNRRLMRNLTDPRFNHPRTYLAQLERIPDDSALTRLASGVVLDGRKTRPSVVHLLDAEPDLPPRRVPIRFRKNVPTSWIELTITEGRNRQVRRMTAGVGFPTLRLIRIKIGDITLTGIPPGASRLMSPQEVARLLARLNIVE